MGAADNRGNVLNISFNSYSPVTLFRLWHWNGPVPRGGNFRGISLDYEWFPSVPSLSRNFLSELDLEFWTSIVVVGSSLPNWCWCLWIVTKHPNRLGRCLTRSHVTPWALSHTSAVCGSDQYGGAAAVTCKITTLMIVDFYFKLCR